MIATTCDVCGCRVGNIPDGGKPVSYVRNAEVVADYLDFKRATQEDVRGEFCVTCFSKACKAFTEALGRR
jgi:hypothetical protein